MACDQLWFFFVCHFIPGSKIKKKLSCQNVILSPKGNALCFLKLVLGCGMGQTHCWPKQVAWPRLMSMRQGSIFLPQEVTAVSMAMSKMNNNTKEKGMWTAENCSATTRMTKSLGPSPSPVSLMCLQSLSPSDVNQV